MADIVLNFRGKSYTIRENSTFEVAEEIEDIVTLGEITTWGRNPKFTKISRCFGTMLRFAGCDVTDQDVYKDMMASITKLSAKGDEEQARGLMAAQAVSALMAVLMGEAPEGDGEDAPGKANAS